MTKTTVYLPEDLKRDLSRMAAATGRSEAQLIRDAIAAMARKASRPRPRGRLYKSGDPGLAAQVDRALAGFGDR